MDNDVYVNWEGGCCGDFILALLISIIYSEKHIEDFFRKHNFLVTEIGAINAVREFNWLAEMYAFGKSDKQREHIPQLWAINPDEKDWASTSTFQSFFNTKQKEQNLIKSHMDVFQAHKLFDLVEGVIINIQHDKNGQQWFINWYEKDIKVNWHVNRSGAKRHWYNMLDEPYVESSYVRPKLTKENIDKILNKKNNTYFNLNNYNLKMQEKYPNKFFQLTLEDIYTDREKVLQLLECITNCKRRQITLDLYDAYINAQRDFTKMYENALTN